MTGKSPKVQFGRLLAEPVRNGIYKTKEFHGRGTKIVNMGELFANPRLRSVPMKRVELSDSENKRFLLSEGDLLFARRSLVAEGAGKCIIVLEIAEPTTFESSIIRARIDKSLAYPMFLYYFFNSTDGLHSLDTIRRQVAVSGITGSDLSCLDINLPPLPEQKAIANILGSLDDKIELNRKMNKTLEELARTIFKSWFVDFDPVVAKSEGRQPEGMDAETAKLFPDSFVDSEIGRIPKGWKISSLRSICKNIYSGGTPRTENPAYWGGDIPWLSSGETRNRFIVATEKFITEEGVANSSTRLAHKGCSVIASAGQGHTRGQTSLLTFDCYVNQSVVVLAADKKAVSDCYLFFNLERRYEQFRQLSDSHSSRGSLTTKLLADLQTVVPPKHLVDCFDSWVAPIVLNISDNIHQSINLSIIRDSLLPRLLSGIVRASDGKRIGGKHAVAM